MKTERGWRRHPLFDVCEVRGSEPRLRIDHCHQEFRFAKSQTPQGRGLRQPAQPANAGFTFVELMASITILLLLTTVALPVVRVQIQRSREVDLHRALRKMRDAIDLYKDFSDRGMIPPKADTFGYPPDLQTLVDGVELRGTATAKYKFLRRLPVDPMTGSTDWGMRSMQDDSDSRSWGGQNVFDIYSKSDGTALDGSKYSDW